jgi:hypothetical protein
VVKGPAKAFPGHPNVVIAAGRFGFIRKAHCLTMEVLELIHRCTTWRIEH